MNAPDKAAPWEEMLRPAQRRFFNDICGDLADQLPLPPASKTKTKAPRRFDAIGDDD